MKRKIIEGWKPTTKDSEHSDTFATIRCPACNAELGKVMDFLDSTRNDLHTCSCGAMLEIDIENIYAVEACAWTPPDDAEPMTDVDFLALEQGDVITSREGIETVVSTGIYAGRPKAIVQNREGAQRWVEKIDYADGATIRKGVMR